jgi:hypothetical protein
MLALYRSGRQAEALDVYQKTRSALVDELGIDPGPTLQRLERNILLQDEGLDLVHDPVRAGSAAVGRRAILVLARADEGFADALALAEQLVLGEPPHELVLAQLLGPGEGDRLPDVAASLGEWRARLEANGASARVAVFTSSAYVEDVVRLASRSEIDLLLVPARSEVLVDGSLDDDLDSLLRQVLCDVGFLVARESASTGIEGPILVPFGGGGHEWAALELGAWLAGSSGRPLHLLGTAAESELARRDASRLLADAGLLIQRASGVAPLPRLVPPGHEGVVEAAANGGLLVIGLSERWGDEGLGPTRWSIAKSVAEPVLFVRRGVRPSGLAPDASATRFGWSVVAGA